MSVILGEFQRVCAPQSSRVFDDDQLEGISSVTGAPLDQVVSEIAKFLLLEFSFSQAFHSQSQTLNRCVDELRTRTIEVITAKLEGQKLSSLPAVTKLLRDKSWWVSSEKILRQQEDLAIAAHDEWLSFARHYSIPIHLRADLACPKGVSAHELMSVVDRGQAIPSVFHRFYHKRAALISNGRLVSWRSMLRQWCARVGKDPTTFEKDMPFNKFLASQLHSPVRTPQLISFKNYVYEKTIEEFELFVGFEIDHEMKSVLSSAFLDESVRMDLVFFMGQGKEFILKQDHFLGYLERLKGYFEAIVGQEYSPEQKLVLLKMYMIPWERVDPNHPLKRICSNESEYQELTTATIRHDYQRLESVAVAIETANNMGYFILSQNSKLQILRNAVGFAWQVQKLADFFRFFQPRGKTRLLSPLLLTKHWDQLNFARSNIQRLGFFDWQIDEVAKILCNVLSGQLDINILHILHNANLTPAQKRKFFQADNLRELKQMASPNKAKLLLWLKKEQETHLKKVFDLILQSGFFTLTDEEALQVAQRSWHDTEEIEEIIALFQRFGVTGQTGGFARLLFGENQARFELASKAIEKLNITDWAAEEFATVLANFLTGRIDQAVFDRIIRFACLPASRKKACLKDDFTGLVQMRDPTTDKVRDWIYA